MDTFIIKIIKVSRPHYWYKNRIGELLEVRIKLNYNKHPEHDNYYIYDKTGDGTERYINYDDCVEYTRYLKIEKLKEKMNEN